ncbi:hypothetical protein HZH68_010611 [Vespula germanica]|uniref:Uncharacterized protein n=1 Tax=Vespula germanica TaxID=30212 RepID=A0A834JUF6_VESGE|nr:hypothetical protein HZH68_010611 [Vespula germanica]
MLLYPITTIASTTSNELYSKQEGLSEKRRTTLPSQYSIASHYEIDASSFAAHCKPTKLGTLLAKLSSQLATCTPTPASHPPRPFTVLALRAALTLPARLVLSTGIINKWKWSASG